jgi:phenylacetate-CoA ligase
METHFWNKQIETMDRKELEALQLAKLKHTVSVALSTPFYGKRLAGCGIKSADEIKSLSDLSKIPFTTKNDLRDAFPYGMLSVDKKEIVRMHASSGTTGIPTTVYHTKDDLGRWTDLVARSIVATGCGPEDVFQNMMTYGLFTGGLGLHYGAEKVGMMVIPAGGGNGKRQFALMRDFQTTVIHATPSYMLHLYSLMAEEGIKRGDLALERAFIGAEPHSEDVRKKIEQLWGIEAYNSYGLSEMNGPGVAFECVYKDNMHVWEDCYIMECVDPDTLQPVPDGEQGELVLTLLCRDASPILRYRTRDLTRIYPATCACGRTSRRIGRIMGRTDDMLIINGVNVFPSQIEEVIMRMKEIGNNYQIVIDKAGALDEMTVKVEVNQDNFSDDMRDLEKLKNKIRENLKATVFINPKVELHESGVLPVYEGKAKRVFDQRY